MAQQKSATLDLERKTWLSKLLDIKQRQKAAKARLLTEQQAPQLPPQPQTHSSNGCADAAAKQTVKRHKLASDDEAEAALNGGVSSQVDSAQDPHLSRIAQRESKAAPAAVAAAASSSSSVRLPRQERGLLTSADVSQDTEPVSPSPRSPAPKKRVFFLEEALTKKSPVGKVDPETGEVFEDLENADDEVMKPVVVTEEMRKVDFLGSLGLITKKALSELQNKKTVRKRRTTANPHFSNAAIEAKRINQMEMAARKAKRKEQSRTRYALVCRRNNDESRSQQERKACTADQSVPPPLSPFAVRVLSATTKDCAVCKELCEPSVDTIIFCVECPCFFHATCVVTMDEIASSGFFSCPVCGLRKTLADEVSSFSGREAASNLSCQTGKPKRRAFGRTTAAEAAPVKYEQDMLTLNQGNNVVSRVSYKSHYEGKRAELCMLLEKKEILELEWTKRREAYNDTLAAFTAAQQKVTVLEAEGKKIEGDVKRLVGFLRSVKIWSEIIDPDEQQPAPRPALPPSIPAPLPSSSSCSSSAAADSKSAVVAVPPAALVPSAQPEQLPSAGCQEAAIKVKTERDQEDQNGDAAVVQTNGITSDEHLTSESVEAAQQ